MCKCVNTLNVFFKELLGQNILSEIQYNYIEENYQDYCIINEQEFVFDEEIKNYLTIKETANIWGKQYSTIRKNIEHNKFDFKDIKRSCNTWIISITAIIKVYGLNSSKIETTFDSFLKNLILNQLITFKEAYIIKQEFNSRFPKSDILESGKKLPVPCIDNIITLQEAINKYGYDKDTIKRRLKNKNNIIRKSGNNLLIKEDLLIKEQIGRKLSYDNMS